MVVRLLLVVLGYLCGSLSFVYLIGRWLRSMDMRRYGSHKLSASNIYHHAGLWAMVLAGIGDLSKAAFPVWLTKRLGFELSTAIFVGLAAMLGHNWPLFFALKGGRGIGTALGTLVILYPLGAAWILAWVVAGRLTPKAAAVPALLGFLTLPILALAQNQPPAIVWGAVGMLLITIVKRIEGNREPLPEGEKRLAVYGRRLLLDRDIRDFDAWIQRRPDEI